MPTLVLVLASAITLAVIYLSVVATVCAVLDPAISRSIAALRILVSWVLPVLGALVTIRVSAEESPIPLRRRWWLWPLKAMLSDEVRVSDSTEIMEMRAAAERTLPGITLTPPP